MAQMNSYSLKKNVYSEIYQLFAIYAELDNNIVLELLIYLLLSYTLIIICGLQTHMYI